jgi:hypothetical protein
MERADGPWEAAPAEPGPWEVPCSKSTYSRAMNRGRRGDYDYDEEYEYEGRLMGSTLFETDLLTALEPGNPGGETSHSTAGGTPAATEVRFMASVISGVS